MVGAVVHRNRFWVATVSLDSLAVIACRDRDRRQLPVPFDDSGGLELDV